MSSSRRKYSGMSYLESPAASRCVEQIAAVVRPASPPRQTFSPSRASFIGTAAARCTAGCCVASSSTYAQDVCVLLRRGERGLEAHCSMRCRNCRSASTSVSALCSVAIVAGGVPAGAEHAERGAVIDLRHRVAKLVEGRHLRQKIAALHARHRERAQPAGLDVGFGRSGIDRLGGVAGQHSFSAEPAPRYGTWTMSVPLLRLKNSMMS